MNETPLVSVAIITYNQKDYLKEAIESVLAQTYTNIEIVVGDDASTDGTHEMLYHYQQQYPNKFILKLAANNVGITANSNAVHFACNGKYIAWLGGDDLMLPTKIEKQVAYLEAHAAHNIVYHNVDVFESPGDKHLYYFNNAKTSFEGGIKTAIEHGTFNCACATMVRRSASPSYGFDSSIPVASDWLYWVEHLNNGGKMGYINEVLGRYRRHQKNVTSNASAHAPQGYLDLFTTCKILSSKYPQFQPQINKRLSIIYRSGRVYKYVENLKKSIQLNPFNLPSWVMLVVYMATFKKIKL